MDELTPHCRCMPVLPPRVDHSLRNALRELALAQDDVVRRDQLMGLGLTVGEADNMLKSGRWQDDADGLIVILHNGPLTRRQQEAVAVLAGGRLCGLAARTAATRSGLVGWDAQLIEVLVPRGTT
jgi:hypothetical protein